MRAPARLPRRPATREKQAGAAIDVRRGGIKALDKILAEKGEGSAGARGKPRHDAVAWHDCVNRVRGTGEPFPGVSKSSTSR
jgi:hypothetical protein